MPFLERPLILPADCIVRQGQGRLDSVLLCVQVRWCWLQSPSVTRASVCPTTPVSRSSWWGPGPDWLRSEASSKTERLQNSQVYTLSPSTCAACSLNDTSIYVVGHLFVPKGQAHLSEYLTLITHATKTTSSDYGPSYCVCSPLLLMLYNLSGTYITC